MRSTIIATATVLFAVAAAPALADPYEGVPNPQYQDGTGDNQVDRLNAGQLAAPPLPPPPGYGPTSYPAPPRADAPPPPMPPGMYAPRPPMYGPPPAPPGN